MGHTHTLCGLHWMAGNWNARSRSFPTCWNIVYCRSCCFLRPLDCFCGKNKYYYKTMSISRQWVSQWAAPVSSHAKYCDRLNRIYRYFLKIELRHTPAQLEEYKKSFKLFGESTCGSVIWIITLLRHIQYEMFFNF